MCVYVFVRVLYPLTCLAQGILSRRAVCPYFAVRTSLVFHAFRAVVMFGIESAFEASFAFCVIFIGPGDEFLARSALCDCHEHTVRRDQRNRKGFCSCLSE